MHAQAGSVLFLLTAGRTHRLGEMASPSALAADRISAMAPHALGLAMDVPFMSCRLCCVLRGARAPNQGLAPTYNGASKEICSSLTQARSSLPYFSNAPGLGAT